MNTNMILILYNSSINEVNIKGLVLDTVLPVFALFHQQKLFKTQPQHCVASLSTCGVSFLSELINRLNDSVQSQ